MERKRVGAALLVLGAALLVLSALADPIGIGEGGGIGWKQITGMVVGAAAIVIGALVLRAKSGETTSAAADV